MPRDFIIESVPFSAANQLLTDAQKPRRAAPLAAYRERLDGLHAQIAGRQAASDDVGPDDLEGQVARAAAQTLGLAAGEVDLARAFVGLGGDSLGALELCARLEERCGVAPPVAAVLDPGTSLAQLARMLGATPTERLDYAAVHGRFDDPVRAVDLGIERFLPEELERAPTLAAGAAGPPRIIFLTGASGFLGRFLLLELLAQTSGQVLALVRAPDAHAAEARLVGVFARSPAFAAPVVAALREGRLQVIPGDLLRPRFGLAATTFADLAARADAVVHAGALVNHVLPYRALFTPNVLGTVEALRLALTGSRKPIHFVSSIAAVAGAPGATPILESAAAADLWPRRPAGTAAGYALGYGTSKWAGEVLLDDAHGRTGLPVTHYRCSILLPHRAHPEQHNPADALSRLVSGLLDTGVAPPSFYAPGTRQPHIDGVPVDVAAAAIAHLILDPPSGDRTRHVYHVANDHWDDGVSLDRFVDWLGTAGRSVVRLADHAEWLAEFRRRLEARPDGERGSSALAILGRWERPESDVVNARLDTRQLRARLAAWGRDDVPVIDEAFVHRWVRALT